MCASRDVTRAMKRKSIIAIIAIAILAAGGMFVYRDTLADEAPAYRFAAIEKGDIESKVTATGALSAVTTVSVGTQVSGQLSDVLVDYNDRVKKGQLLARIDPTLAQQAVVDAQANVDKANASLLQMQRDYARNRELTSVGLVARSAFEQSESSLAVARAGVKSAQVALDRARQNLAYTEIFAPIDGVVVERNVQQGQTVAASLSAPQLFLIANDLAQMQILAQVGESDIAQIAAGQPVKFSVQALPKQTFEGTVQQVRLQSTTQDNVVSYTVVIGVENPKAKLLPGMTARVSFLTKSAEGVLKVSNAALRFRPAGGTRGSALWYLDEKGQLKAARVRTGINDGTMTEVQGKDIRAGMKVIAGTASATAQTAQKTSAAPLGQSNQRPQGGPRPGGF